MKYVYNRVSTRGQAKEGNSLEAQGRAVLEVGDEKRFIRIHLLELRLIDQSWISFCK